MHPVRRRLVSIISPWRIVPELDGLSDEEGRALVKGLEAQRRALSERQPRPAWQHVLDAVAKALLLVMAIWCVMSWSPLVIVGVAVGIAMMALTVREGLPSKVGARLREDWCQGCAYPMYELPASEGPVACPRCGRPCIAREAIKAAADVLACDVDAHAERVRRERRVVTACGCGYPLRGLPVEDGCVRCPECGEEYGAREGGFVRTDDDCGGDRWAVR